MVGFADVELSKVEFLWLDLSDGTSYYIPNSDLSFFKELALRMKWQVVDKKSRQHQLLLQASRGLMNLLVNGRTSALLPK